MANPPQNLMLSTSAVRRMQLAIESVLSTFVISNSWHQIEPIASVRLSIFLLADRVRGCGDAYAVTCHQGELDGYLADFRMVSGAPFDPFAPMPLRCQLQHRP